MPDGRGPSKRPRRFFPLLVGDTAARLFSSGLKLGGKNPAYVRFDADLPQPLKP
jgi:hypothetical protein